MCKNTVSTKVPTCNFILCHRLFFVKLLFCNVVGGELSTDYQNAKMGSKWAWSRMELPPSFSFSHSQETTLSPQLVLFANKFKWNCIQNCIQHIKPERESSKFGWRRPNTKVSAQFQSSGLSIGNDEKIETGSKGGLILGHTFSRLYFLHHSLKMRAVPIMTPPEYSGKPSLKIFFGVLSEGVLGPIQIKSFFYWLS